MALPSALILSCVRKTKTEPGGAVSTRKPNEEFVC